MINNRTLGELEEMNFGSDVDALESYVSLLQDAAADGEPIVENPVYDKYKRLLEELKPDSEVLKRNWEKDTDEELTDLDVVLNKYGMKSIKTCTNMEDTSRYIETFSKLHKPFDLIASTKLNGHAGRVVYRHGELVAASTRGRYKKGRSLLRHMKYILPNYVEAFKDFDIIEIRGEILVSLENFEKLKHLCKTPLSSVSSLVRDSVTDKELEMLDFVAYKIIVAGDEELFDSLSDEMDYLDNCGFSTAQRKVYKDVQVYDLQNTLENIINDFEAMYKGNELKFYTDGIVVALNNNEDFYSLGTDGNSFNGNLALKMGEVWESNQYAGIVKDIVWEYGKRWIIPKAVIEPVVTVTGVEVTTVPLYNLGNLQRLGLVPGATIYFRFGGETGVQLLTSDGKSVTTLDKINVFG